MRCTSIFDTGTGYDKALAAADHRRLPADGKTGERLQRGFDRALAAANQCHGEEIHQRALGLMHDGRLERVPLRLGDELRQPLRHIRIIWRIVWHLTPRAGQRASTAPGKSARMVQRDAINANTVR